MERLGETTKKKVEDEGVVFVTQQIFQDNDWLSSVDALIEQLIQKKQMDQKMWMVMLLLLGSQLLSNLKKSLI